MKITGLTENLDLELFFSTLLLAFIGIATVYSATHQTGASAIPLRDSIAFGLEPSASVFYKNYYIKQIIWCFAGIIFMLVFSRIEYQLFIEISYKLYIFVIFLLICVFIFGKLKMGSQRWLSFGPISFQPSEFTKLVIILALVRFLSDKKGRIGIFEGLFKSLVLIGIPMFLIIKQPDLGTALLFVPLSLILLFIVGVRIKYIFYIIGSAVIFFPFLLFLLRDYQRQRILVFLNPGLDPLGAGYNIIQSQIAVGSGGILGKGFLKGTQSQLDFLPAHHTDFIFSVLAEEWGLLGACILLLIYIIFILRGIKIAVDARDTMGSLLATGIIVLFAFQVIININMAVGLLPVVGMPLPFLSYGGSSLFVNMIAVGILLNIRASSKKFSL